MDRSWIHASRLSAEYSQGIDSFVEFAKNNDPDYKGAMKCPCKKCVCIKFLRVEVVREHLVINGFDTGYTKWICHGERVKMPDKDGGNRVETSFEFDRLDDMIDDVEKEISKKPEILEELITSSEKPLYGGCTKHTLLSAVLKLFNLKARHGVSDKGFTDILDLVHELLPDGNLMPRKTYDAKKILCPMGMGYKKIHACPNDCMLFTGEYEKLYSCIVCGNLRYKKRIVWTMMRKLCPRDPQQRLFGISPSYLGYNVFLRSQKMRII